MSEPRVPRPDELDDLSDLAGISFGFEPRRPGERRRRHSGHGRSESRIIAMDGKPVSHIRIVYSHLSIEGAKVKVASFGGVCTHPDYRERGIASRLLDHCLNEVTGAGTKLLIISGMRGLYRRIDAVPVGPVWTASLRADSLACDTVELTARPAEACDWPVLAALHQAEPVRFLRSARFYAGAAAGGHSRAHLIEHDGAPIAYLCLSRIWDLPHDAPVRRFREYAGSRAALLAALPAVFRATGLSEIQVEFPMYDREFPYLASRYGIPLEADTIYSHTIRLLDLPGLMRALRPYLQARLSPSDLRGLGFQQADGVCRFSFAGEHAELNLSQAGFLVLGGQDKPEIGGALGRVTSAIFPIPVPLPGLNYA